MIFAMLTIPLGVALLALFLYPSYADRWRD